MKKYYLLLVMLYASSVNADVPLEQRHEVDHLINYVKTTSCQMNRNGQFHAGPAALAHIQKKYSYFKDKIRSTEQFIELSATKSTMSGKYYVVKCGNNQPIKTKDWLLRELKLYRGISKT